VNLLPIFELGMNLVCPVPVESAPMIVSPFLFRIHYFVLLWKHLLWRKYHLRHCLRNLMSNLWKIRLKLPSAKMLFELSEFFVGAGFIIFYCFDEAKKTNFCEIVPASFCLLALEKPNGVRVVSLKKKTFAFQKLSQSAKFSPWELLKSLCWSKSSFLNLEKPQTTIGVPGGGL